MKIAGEHTLNAPRESVWQALLDPAVLANTLPGCEELEQAGENEFHGRLVLKVGPVQGRFEGTVKLSELDPPNGYHLSIEGKGAPGFVNGKGRIELVEDDGATRLRYEIEAQVGGRIAGVGQRLLDSSAKVITRQGIAGLDRQISRRQETGQNAEGTGGEPPSPVGNREAAPSKARFATRFLGGLVGELIPRERRALVGFVALTVLIVVVLLALRACSG